MTERAQTPHQDRDRASGRQDRAGEASKPTAPTDLALIIVIAACFVPIGLLVIAVHGGGLTTVVIAFVALVLILTAFVTLLGRALDEPGGEHP